MKYYSDVGQDRWIIEEIFSDDLRNGYKGFFVEAGAATGVGASNTYLLEKEFGWNGLLVEPNTKFFSQLIRARSAQCINGVLSDRDGELEFIQAGFLGAVPDHVRAVFTSRGLDLYAHASYQRDADGSIAKRSVQPAWTLATLFRQIGAPSTIDYLSLDVEGSEFAVLQGFPFDTHRIRALTIETRFPHAGVMYDHKHRQPCRQLLEVNGYRLVQTLEIDDCYISAG